MNSPDEPLDSQTNGRTTVPPPAEQYETLYGVHFLDDLHNFFPALLYDSASFPSVQSVLRYIQQQARNRFDLFSYGQREYLSRVQPRGVQTLSVPIPAGTPTSTFQAPSTATVSVSLTQLLQQAAEGGEEEEEEEALPPLDNALSRVLLNLLQIPPAPLVRDYGLGLSALRARTMDQFLQPVEVAPTPEQIAATTTVGNRVSDTDATCAICQDNLTAEQEGRKLNACSHWFHRECIDTWLTSHVQCPVCRHDIREPLEQ